MKDIYDFETSLKCNNNYVDRRLIDLDQNGIPDVEDKANIKKHDENVDAMQQAIDKFQDK